MHKVAQDLGRRLLIVWASNDREVDTAIDSIVEQSAGGLYVTPDGFFSANYAQIAALAVRQKIPAMHESRLFPHAGGLISYGADVQEGHRQAGLYVAKILRGAKPGDLPVLQPTKFDLVINLRIAKALGVTIPNELLIQAAELIE